ncbi:hypothetical protein [Chitinophaga barathri]|uniref:Uncharacterized protein n=1 Tax=Chitinophaga barathri TaxID=1647451 RepID=A0A3N4MGQ2_9BACT|nr:hypothetical protein [Chitinophaga barathri]RPD43232.1 hypothetical protein EG028_02745 [Chitinophaga barathri]
MKTASCFSFLCILLLAGCIKDPGPEEPPVPAKPQWLVSKITIVRRSGSPNPLPGEPAQHFLKQVYELHYNSHFKPVSRYVYTANGDTLQLRFESKDSLLYDANRRMTQSDNYLPAFPSVNARRKFIYPGNDTLPSQMEVWYSSYPNRDSLYLSGSVRYLYRPDTVLEIARNIHGLPDTARYVFAGQNFRDIIYQGNIQIPVYGQYDNSIALERLMSLSHGLAFRLPMDYGSPPLLSRNNWTGEGPQGWQRTSEYTGDGSLVSRYVITEYNPAPTYWTFRIDYFSTNP